MFQKGLYPLSHFAKTGKSQQVATFPWISADFEDLSASPYAATAPVGFQLGTPWYDDFGNVFLLKLLRASALTVGQTTQWGTTDAGGGHVTDTVSNALTTVRVVSLTTGGLTAGAEVNNWLYDEVEARTATVKTDGLKLIKANTASLLTVSNVDTKASNQQSDADAYAVAPVNPDALTIIRPYQTIVFPTAAAATGEVVGIALGAVVQDKWHYEQIGGLAMVSAVGAVTALVINQPAVPSAALAGAVIGAAAVAANQVGICAASKATAVGLLPVWLTINGMVS